MSSVLEIDSVIKTYDDKLVLSDIYLKCETSDIYAIFGRNGAGKSTLLKILFGTLSADRKFIRIDGKVYKHPFVDKNLINYLPQTNFLPSNLTVGRIISLYNDKQAANRFKVDPIISGILQRKISELSGGELRYLEVKLLVQSNSKFILLDEPFSGVSPLIVDEIKQLIVENSKEKGIIISDHDYRSVIDIANRMGVIYDGGLKTISDKNELIKYGYLTGEF
jgi:ABC-type multidrug transport system ATPase subunit